MSTGVWDAPCLARFRRTRRHSSWLVRWALVLLPLVAAGREGVAQTATTLGATPVAGALRPGDAVRLRVWREPDLSGEFPVDERGEVSFPKLGATRVTGMSPDSLNRWLLAGYGAYLRDASIEVTPLRRVSVTGAVRTPGIYRVEPTMTVADAVALAGGASPEGERDRVELMRGGAKLETRLRANTRLAESALQSGDQLVVPERSWARRNAGVIIGAVSSVAFLVVALVNNN